MRRAAVVGLGALALGLAAPPPGWAQAAAAAAATPAARQAPVARAALGNQDILRWYRQRLPPQVIVARIRASARVAFDLSTAALERLQHAGVSAAALAAMIAQQRRQAVERARAAQRRQASAQRRAAAAQRREAAAQRLAWRNSRELARSAGRQLSAEPPWPAPAVPGFLPAIAPALAWVAGISGEQVRPACGFVLRSDGILVAAWPRRRAPESARVRLGNGAVYDRPRLLDLDTRRGLLWLRLPAQGLAALEFSRRASAAAPARAAPLLPAQTVYLLIYARFTGERFRLLRGISTAAPALAAQLRPARLGKGAGTSWGVSGQWLEDAGGATPGSPVFGGDGRWLGIATEPVHGSARLLLLPRGELTGHTRRQGRLLPLPTPAGSPALQRFYITDLTGHDYGARLAAELIQRSALRRAQSRRQARWLLQLTLLYESRRRIERLVVRDAATRRQTWSGEAPIMLFRRSAARRLADEWLKSLPDERAGHSQR